MNLVTGRSIQVGERELAPVVRVTSHVQRHATVGSQSLAGQGWHTVHLRPVAVLERSSAGERIIPIHDRTRQIMGGLLLAALVIPMLLALATRLARSK